MFEDDQLVRPDGLTVRRLRHERGWSIRDLAQAVARASEAASGLPSRLTPSQLAGIEERGEHVPYETLCLLAAAFDCDPIDLVAEAPAEDEATGLTGR